MNRVNPTTQAKRLLFLQSLAQLGNVTAAAKWAGLDRVALYKLRRRNPSFARAWAESAEMGAGALEDEAVRRAAEGRLEPVFFQGVQCGSVRKYSDGLLMFLLKARLPRKYKDRRDVATSGEHALHELLALLDGGTRELPSLDG